MLLGFSEQLIVLSKDYVVVFGISLVELHPLTFNVISLGLFDLFLLSNPVAVGDGE